MENILKNVMYRVPHTHAVDSHFEAFLMQDFHIILLKRRLLHSYLVQTEGKGVTPVFIIR